MSDTQKTDPLAQHTAMWADQYALTMAQVLFANNKHYQITTFHGYIRTNPYAGGYLLTAGQNILMAWLDQWSFSDADIDILRAETAFNPRTGQDERLYTDDFLDMLAATKLDVTIDMMPEGEIAFPDEPIVRVHGPVWQCLLLEAAILNILNSQSLFATLASRFREIAGGKTVLELGLRRAQMLGGLEASRAAYIGGIDGTSNYLAKKHYGIPTSGTMAHAMVMLYESELGAFAEYANAMPHNTIFLVDTYDSLKGVENAIQTCRDLNLNMKGIRLDSGDLAYLSKKARIMLDDAGFKDAKIAASNDLDEKTISSLIDQGAKIDVWGIGTNLVTSKAQPALGGVYKLGAIYGQELNMNDIPPDSQGVGIRGVVKLSEQNIKTSIPGDLDIVRFVKKDHLGHWQYDGDMIYDRSLKTFAEKTDDPDYPMTLMRDMESVRKYDESLSKVFPAGTHLYYPLQKAFDKGQRVRDIEDVHTAKKRAQSSLKMLHYGHKRLLNPHIYVAGLENSLFEKRRALILNIRRGKGRVNNG